MNDLSKIDISKVDPKYSNVINKVIDMNEKSNYKLPTSECLENICYFIDAFPNLSDEYYYRLSRYNYEEEWFCYLYSGLGNDIKAALDYCSSYGDDAEDKYLHYLIFNKYLGHNIKDEKYLFVSLDGIDELYNESYQQVLKKIEKEEKLCVKII